MSGENSATSGVANLAARKEAAAIEKAINPDARVRVIKHDLVGVDDISSLPLGRYVTDRWKIVEKLGEGGGGAVYKVEDTTRPKLFRACKVEGGKEGEANVLKLEYEILQNLQNTQCAVQLIMAGRLPEFRFIIIQLLDKDLYALKRSLDEPFSEGSMFKIGILTLYSIKQLHELGYVHRDVKPGNLMLGVTGRERRTVYLIDYGMVRAYAKKGKDGKQKLRVERTGDKILFRGTLRYCSMNVHLRKEQCRADDLWAMLYTMTELFFRLPWNRENSEEKIMAAKKKLKDEIVFANCPKEFIEIKKYLKTLKFEDRPDYFKLYEIMWKGMKRYRFQFTTPFEWEEPQEMETGIEVKEEEKKAKKKCSADELDYRLFPIIHPEKFKENIIGI